MNGYNVARMVQGIAVALLLGGCAFGQKYSYQAATVPMSRMATSAPVALAVQDRRPYVVSQNKPESFVGLSRGGFGNPFDVNTASGQPMALDMRDAIVSGMRARGIEVKVVAASPCDNADRIQRGFAASGARRLMLVTLSEWKSDLMISAALHYDVTLVVLDEKGTELARARTNGRDNIGPSPHSSVGPAFARKFEALFDDDKILQALK